MLGSGVLKNAGTSRHGGAKFARELIGSAKLAHPVGDLAGVSLCAPIAPGGSHVQREIRAVRETRERSSKARSKESGTPALYKPLEAKPINAE